MQLLNGKLVTTLLAGMLIVAAPLVAGAQVGINEVFYAGTSAADDWIELKNTGSSAVDVSGYWLCTRFLYQQVGNLFLLDGSGFVIPAGGIITVMSWTNLDDTSADMGLYESSSFGSASAMLDFVQWGGSGIGRESVADAAGLWNAGDFVPAAGPEESTMWTGENSGAGELTLSSDFGNGMPTPGLENTPVSTDAVTWSRIKALYR